MQFSMKNRFIAVGITLGIVFATVFSIGSAAKIQFENKEDAAAYEQAQDDLANLNAEQDRLKKELAAAKKAERYT